MTVEISLTKEMKSEYELYGLLPTLNKMGYMKEDLGPYTRDFVDYCATTTKPVLDVGTAYGFTAIAALNKGANVIANDIDGHHLEILKNRVPLQFMERLQLLPGKIPGGVKLAPSSVEAILASRVFNYLSGTEIMQALNYMYEWLVPGGKLFITTETPYKKMFEKFIPLYEQKKAKGDEWPGELEDIRPYTYENRIAFLPQSLHLIEEPVLCKAVEKAGFVIEVSSSFSKYRLPEDACWDGQETAGLIAYKPKT